eukprot:gene16679-22812_t
MSDFNLYKDKNAHFCSITHVPSPQRVADRYESFSPPIPSNSNFSNSTGNSVSSGDKYHENTNKFRQLPCRAFISMGTCPYRERCVYLHDPRITSRIEVKTNSRKKSKDDVVIDSFFWPVMGANSFNGKVDRSGQPIVMQEYKVPPSMNTFGTENNSDLHDKALYSLWMHFTDYCQSIPWANNTSAKNIRNKNHHIHSTEDTDLNSHTRRPRLNIFKQLSRGEFDTKESKNEFLISKLNGSESPRTILNSPSFSEILLQNTEKEYKPVLFNEHIKFDGINYHSEIQF